MDFSRRSFLKLIKNTTFFFLCFLGLSKYSSAQTNEPVLRPPGAVDEEAFIAGCIRCGICIDVCRSHQTGVLKTMTLVDGYRNAGLPRFVTPDYYCTRCLECNLVCPTRVLKKTTPDKLGIGIAIINKEKCLLSMGKFCDRCFEFCELGAIVEDEAFVFQNNNHKHSGKMRARFPKIKEDICDGCGVCAHSCPVFQIIPNASKRQPGR